MNYKKLLMFTGLILYFLLNINNIWAGGNKEAFCDGKGKNCDVNGWFQDSNGKWLPCPKHGAVYEIRPEYSQQAGISGSIPVTGYFDAAQQTISGTNRLDNNANPGAHGFAAEQANTMDDILHGRNARVVGTDNAKDGPDRIVNNVKIQTKYYKSFQESVDSCFSIDSSGKYQFRYFDEITGRPNQIEVPRDQYDNAILQMKDRIRDGSVRGVTDPDEAVNIIRKGSITYRQSINIGKAGTIDSLIFDAKTGVVSCGFAFGISALIDYWSARRIGIEPEIAIKGALITGFKVGGIAFASTVLAGQLTKMGFNPLPISPSINTGNNLQINPTGLLGPQSFTKLLRGNTIAAIASVGVLTAIDTAKFYDGKISGKQLFKNIIVNTGSAAGAVAGATAGATFGANIGNSIASAPGAAVGGVLGGLGGGIAGGIAAGFIVKTAVGNFIEDDAVELVEIINTQFAYIANSYLVTTDEIEQAVTEVQKTLYDGTKLIAMFETDNKIVFARSFLIPIFENIATNRSFVELPNDDQISYALYEIFEEIFE